MTGKAPSAGQKVWPGQNAPVTQEGTGAVASDSLAAESARAGGGFADNREMSTSSTTYGTSSSSSGNDNPSSYYQSHAQTQTESDSQSQHPTNPNPSHHQSSSSEGQGAPAPSYASAGALYLREAGPGAARPHGRNLTAVAPGEDFPGGETKTVNSLAAEPGSMDDPARVAERRFLAGTQGAAGRDAGPRQGGRVGATTGAYEALGGDTSA